MWPPLLAIALQLGGHMAAPDLGREPWVWQPEPGEFELFVGNIKMGKSHAARTRARRVRRLIAWDPQGDEGELGSGRLTIGQAERILEERPELLLRGTVRLSIRPTAWTDEDLRAEFERFCRLCWRVGGVCMKVEETGGVTRAGEYTGVFNRVLREGRHRWLSVILVGQRFSMVPVIARTNATRLVVFQHGFDDAESVAARLSSGSPTPMEPQQIVSLKPREFIEWTPTEGARIRPPLAERSKP